MKYTTEILCEHDVRLCILVWCKKGSWRLSQASGDLLGALANSSSQCDRVRARDLHPHCHGCRHWVVVHACSLNLSFRQVFESARSPLILSRTIYPPQNHSFFLSHCAQSQVHAAHSEGHPRSADHKRMSYAQSKISGLFMPWAWVPPGRHWASEFVRSPKTPWKDVPDLPCYPPLSRGSSNSMTEELEDPLYTTIAIQPVVSAATTSVHTKKSHSCVIQCCRARPKCRNSLCLLLMSLE